MLRGWVPAWLRLAALHDEVLPLELALLTDPELAHQRRQMGPALPPGRPVGPPDFIARYLAAEQRLGRVRGDADPEQLAVIMLATLFGLSVLPSDDGAGVDQELVAAAVKLLVAAIEPRPPRPA